MTESLELRKLVISGANDHAGTISVPASSSFATRKMSDRIEDYINVHSVMNGFLFARSSPAELSDNQTDTMRLLSETAVKMVYILVLSTFC